MKKLIEMRKIIDTFFKPKIIINYDKDRAFWGCEPYIAVYEGYDGAPIDYDTPSQCPIGLGFSEEEAIDDLLENTK
jgi:hypothetical protein